jgi:dienelactone hydrolase
MFHVKHKSVIGLVFLILTSCTQLPTPAPIANITDTAMQIVKFPSEEPGKPTELRGFYYPPTRTVAKSATKVSAIILAHGCSGMVDDNDKLKPGLAGWVEQLTGAGYAVLAVDSFIPRGHTEVCTKTDRPITERRERPRDAYGALAYLAKRADINPDAIYLMGFSNGATGSMYAAEADTALFKSAQLKFKAVMAFYPGCTAASQRNLKFGVLTAIFIGREDDWTPAAACETLVAGNGSLAQIYLYDNAYHGFDAPGNKVRVRMDVRNRNIPSLANGVHVGGNDVARAKAQADVMAFLAKY